MNFFNPSLKHCQNWLTLKQGEYVVGIKVKSEDFGALTERSWYRQRALRDIGQNCTPPNIRHIGNVLDHIMISSF